MDITLLKPTELKKTGGGVGIFLKSNLCYQRRSDLTVDHELFESIFVEIDKDLFHKNRNILIGVIYRPPNTDLKLFNESIKELLDTIGKEHKYCYLMGDYNINLLNYDKHTGTTSFVDMLHANYFVSLINRPTRVTNKSATLIDNIFTNCFCNSTSALTIKPWLGAEGLFLVYDLTLRLEYE